MTAPRPLFGASAQAGLDGVPRDVADGQQSVTVSGDRDGMVGSLEDMSGRFVAAVERLRIAQIQPVHAVREAVVGSFDEYVVVVCHEAERMAFPQVAFDDATQPGKKPASVTVVEIDGTTVVPSAVDVMKAGCCEPGSSTHHATVGSAAARKSCGGDFGAVPRVFRARTRSL